MIKTPLPRELRKLHYKLLMRKLNYPKDDVTESIIKETILLIETKSHPSEFYIQMANKFGRSVYSVNHDSIDCIIDPLKKRSNGILILTSKNYNYCWKK